jgi:hypothetical protein
MAFTPTHATSAARRGLIAALGRIACAGAIAAIAALLALAGAAPAFAAAPAANFTLHSFAIPTRFSAADNETYDPIEGKKLCSSEVFVGCDAYQVTATNAGAAPTDGSAVALTDTLPGGLTVKRVEFFWSGAGRVGLGRKIDLNVALPKLGLPAPCTIVPLECKFTLPEFGFSLEPDDTLEMVIYVTVPNETSTLTNAAVVEGGGAPKVSTEAQNPLGGPLPPFGPLSFSAYIANAAGQPATQAAEHPYELTTRIELNNAFRIGPNSKFDINSVKDPKDVSVDLPLGFLGSAIATPKCTFAELSSRILDGEGGCPKNTIVGHILTEPFRFNAVDGPIYNMVPEHGVAAELGFVDVLTGAHVLYASVVPTPSGYVLRTTAPDIPQLSFAKVLVTIYGNPAAKDARVICGGGSEPKEVACRAELEKSASPFFTNPSDCHIDPATGRPVPLRTTVHMDSWQSPGRVNADGSPDLSDPNWISMSSTSPGMTGCDKLRFDASLSLQPTTTVADSPAGVDIDIKVPQSAAPGTLATPPLKKGVVTLPQGFTVNPSSAGGLGACSPGQIGLGSAAKPTCPDASKIGTVELTTPLLPGVLHGSVYLATQYENPFGSLLAGYIVVDDPDTGVVVKIPGELKADPDSGQISGVFDDNPQFPFSELRLHFKSGPRGALATPQSCGTFTTTSSFTPWSAPDSGLDATPFDESLISSGCAGGFAPTFSAGTVGNHAGGFSPLTVTLQRNDGEQRLAGLTVTTPPGLAGVLAGVPQCPEPQSSRGQCSPQSQIGETTVAAGVGPTPYWVKGGRVYLTGPYNGGPFGLSVVVPAIAGPFNLGNVVVRASIRVDPRTAQVTVVSDPLPQMVDSVEGLHSGIPADLRTLNVLINRPGFTFNPTNCEPLSIDGTFTGAQGASATVSSRFQAANCATLSFKPSFTVSTQGHTSKASGASLTVKVTQRPGEANIRKVNVQLPLALPSRLTTLQKACTEAQFNANPAGCPEGSNVGSATAHTPVLNAPLTGPAYLVSHGSAAFPDLEFVLQGEGITIVLDGKTDIKKGITYSRFETIPDAPISSFQAILPQGPHSVLAASGNLCVNTKTITVKRRVSVRSHGKVRHVLRSHKKRVAASLVMPTTITGQNGAVVKQATNVAVSECAKAAKKKKGKRARRHGG